MRTVDEGRRSCFTKESMSVKSSNLICHLAIPTLASVGLYRCLGGQHSEQVCAQLVSSAGLSLEICSFGVIGLDSRIRIRAPKSPDE